MAQTGYTPIQTYYSTTASAVPLAANLANGEFAVNITDGKLYYKDNSGVVQAMATLAHSAGNFSDILTAITTAKGATGDRPGTPIVGMLRYNTSTNQFEGYSGSSPAWNPVGGATVVNDTATATVVYPLFASATSGTATTVYTSNAKYLYKPSTGELSVSTPVASNGIFVNNQTMSSSQTIAAGTSGFTIGPFSIASGAVLTLASGSRHVII